MLPAFPTDHIDFEPTIEVRTAFLKLAARRFIEQTDASPLLCHAFDKFCDEEASWLDDWALFAALRQANDYRSWTEWAPGLVTRDPAAMDEAMVQHRGRDRGAEGAAVPVLPSVEPAAPKARDLGIAIIGDIPIFTAHDSADVWAAPHLFHLDDKGNPTVVAGVPPDYFSATGQRWGDAALQMGCAPGRRLRLVEGPAARHPAHGGRGPHRPLPRLRSVLRKFPPANPPPSDGRWVESPGNELFNALKAEFGGGVPVIAEDLGIITPDVVALRDGQGFPGMRVMQFAFGSDTLAEDYVPENYPENSVAYTGTHDNDTVIGLFKSGEGENSTRTAEQIEAERRGILNYTGTDGHRIALGFH